MTTDNDQNSGIDSSGWDRGSKGFAGIGEREAQQIVGTTDAAEHRRQVAESESKRDRRQRERKRDRESGIGVSPTLENPLGQRLIDGPLAGIKRNAAVARKVVHRLDQERDELLGRAAGQRDGELLVAAWDAAEAKAKVPSIMVAAQEFDRSAIPTSHPIARHGQFEVRMRGHWANENREVVLAAWKDIESILEEETAAILDESLCAFRTLVDATEETGNADAVIADGRPEVLTAFREWPNLVERWRVVQCVRQYLALVEHNGFDERHPERLIRTEAQAIERDVWRSQFIGREVDCDDAEDALRWYADKKIEAGVLA